MMPEQVQAAATSSPQAREGKAIHNPTKPNTSRRGQSLVEFAVVALVLYMLLAAILTFGHALYVAQGLQSAADLAAREISRTPLPAMIEDVNTGDDRSFNFDDALADPHIREYLFDPNLLVFRVADLEADETFFDRARGWPLLNRQLATLMIVDDEFIRYPGALLTDPNMTSGFTVGIPLVVGRDVNGVETIRWVPVVEEIESDTAPDPFRIDSAQRGIVALRINYPFQSASMSSFRPNEAGPFEPTVGSPNLANDGGVVEINPTERPGELINQPLIDGDLYAGTYGGQYGLGAQGALGQTVRPYRRVISAQAIYRREIFE